MKEEFGNFIDVQVKVELEEDKEESGSSSTFAQYRCNEEEDLKFKSEGDAYQDIKPAEESINSIEESFIMPSYKMMEGDMFQNDDDDMQMAFVRVLDEHRILLEKNNVPTFQAAKAKALHHMCSQLKRLIGQSLTEKQLKKKIYNMKSELKKKSDRMATGKKKIVLKMWERKFLELIDPAFLGPISMGISSAVLPVQTPVSSTLSTYRTFRQSPLPLSPSISHPPFPSSISSSHPSFLNSTSSSECSVQSRKRMPSPLVEMETAETVKLSNSELHRLVMLEQLRYLRMKIKRFQDEK